LNRFVCLTPKDPEALAVAERLKNECFQVERAMMLRARIHLNMGRFEDAAKESAGLVEIWPSEAFVAGFALAEKGDAQEAAAHLLYATLHHPETSRALANGRGREPRSWREERDRDALEELRNNLPAYFVLRKNAGVTALQTLLRSPRIVSLIERSQLLERRHSEGRRTDREAFDERTKMLTLAFARGVVASIAAEGGSEHLVGGESP
jgi:hypothetical protein